MALFWVLSDRVPHVSGSPPLPLSPAVNVQPVDLLLLLKHQGLQGQDPGLGGSQQLLDLVDYEDHSDDGDEEVDDNSDEGIDNNNSEDDTGDEDDNGDDADCSSPPSSSSSP